MNSLYSLGVRQTSSLHADLESMAQMSTPSSSIQGQLAASLAAFSRTIDDYESLAKREALPVKQEKARSRVIKFREDYSTIRARFNDLKKTASDAQTASSRASLLGTETLSTPRHRAHTSTSASNLGPSSSTRFELLSSETAESPFSYRPNNPTANHEGDLRNAYSRREELFIDETDSKLDALIQQGQEIWGSLADQKGWLKGTRRKVLDAANGIKGGREVIGWVERRSAQDRWIFALGASVTLAAFSLIWWFLG